MDVLGHLNLNNNMIQQVAFDLESTLPSDPPLGRLVFWQNRVFLASRLDGGVPVWVPLTNTINTYVHAQPVGSQTWTITHNLNTATPMVQVYSELDNSMFIPDNVTITSNNELTVTMSSDVTGRAVVMSGEFSGFSVPTYSYVHTQSVASTSWVIMHSLGYEPLIRVFVGNSEVQPSTITHNSINQATLTFASAVSGIARLV